TCFGQENLRLERGTNHHTGQPLWRVVCAGSQPATPHPLQLFEQLGEPLHDETAGDAGDHVPPQAKKCVQEEMTPAPSFGEPDAGRRPSTGEEHDLSTQMCEEHKLPQPSPASPAALQRAQEEGAVPASTCSVHGCGEAAIVHSEVPDEEERTSGL